MFKLLRSNTGTDRVAGNYIGVGGGGEGRLSHDAWIA